LPKSWSAAASMPAHDCAFALFIAFAEPLPVEGQQVGKWEEPRFTQREQICSASLVGLRPSLVGWNRKRVKTNDARRAPSSEHSGR
jgi:hypothetical protein